MARFASGEAGAPERQSPRARKIAPDRLNSSKQTTAPHESPEQKRRTTIGPRGTLAAHVWITAVELTSERITRHPEVEIGHVRRPRPEGHHELALCPGQSSVFSRPVFSPAAHPPALIRAHYRGPRNVRVTGKRKKNWKGGLCRPPRPTSSAVFRHYRRSGGFFFGVAQELGVRTLE